MLTLKVLVVAIDAQWEGMGDVGSARYEPALLRVLFSKTLLFGSSHFRKSLFLLLLFLFSVSGQGRFHYQTLYTIIKITNLVGNLLVLV